MSNKKSKIKEKVNIFREKYESKLVLILGIILVAIVSFEVGILKGGKIESKTLVIEKASELNSPEFNKESVLGAQVEKDTSNENANSGDKNNIPEVNNKECLFVGSKNSTKYHKPDCRWAKNIKPANLVCFKNAEDAKNRGYLPDSNCIK